MTNSLQVARSSVAGKIPGTDKLLAGALAVNTADKRMFFSTGDVIKALANLTDLTWDNIGNKPTTISEFGITDAYTKTEITSALSGKADKATTLAGYGITDANLVSLALRRTTTRSLTTTATEITFNTVDAASDTTVVRQGTTTSRIEILQAGVYAVVFECESINTTTANLDRFQIRLNGADLANGLITVNCRSTRQHSTKLLVLALDVGDYLTVAASSSAGTTGTMQIGATFTAVKLTGLQGPAGPAGAPGGQSSVYYSAANLDNPTNANWAVNLLAPANSDATNAALTVRSFDDTAEEGVGATIYIPPGTTSMTLTVVGRAATAPTAIKAVVPKLYARTIPNGAAVGSWSAGTVLSAFQIPTNAFFQTYQVTIPIASLGLAAATSAQLELTRLGSSASDTLVGDFNLLNMSLSFL